MMKLRCGVFESQEKESELKEWITQQDIEGKFHFNIYTMECIRESKNISKFSNKNVNQSIRRSDIITSNKTHMEDDSSISIKSTAFIATNLGIGTCLESDRKYFAKKWNFQSQQVAKSALLKYFKINMIDQILEGETLVIEFGYSHLMLINCELRKIHIIIDYRCITCCQYKSSSSSSLSGKSSKRFSKSQSLDLALAFYDVESKSCLVATFRVFNPFGTLIKSINKHLYTASAAQNLLNSLVSIRNTTKIAKNRPNIKNHGIYGDIDSDENRAMRKAISSVAFEISLDKKIDLYSNDTNESKQNKNIDTKKDCNEKRSKKKIIARNSITKIKTDNSEKSLIKESSIVLRRKNIEIQNAYGNTFKNSFIMSKKIKKDKLLKNRHSEFRFIDISTYELTISSVCLRLQISHDYMSFSDKYKLIFELVFSKELSSKIDFQRIEKIAKNQIESTNNINSAQNSFPNKQILRMIMKFDKIVLIDGQDNTSLDVIHRMRRNEQIRFEFDIDNLFAVGICADDNSGIYFGYRQPNILGAKDVFIFYLLQNKFKENMTNLVKHVVRRIKLIRKSKELF